MRLAESPSGNPGSMSTDHLIGSARATPAARSKLDQTSHGNCRFCVTVFILTLAHLSYSTCLMAPYGRSCEV